MKYLKLFENKSNSYEETKASLEDSFITMLDEYSPENNLSLIVKVDAAYKYNKDGTYGMTPNKKKMDQYTKVPYVTIASKTGECLIKTIKGLDIDPSVFAKELYTCITHATMVNGLKVMSKLKILDFSSEESFINSFLKIETRNENADPYEVGILTGTQIIFEKA